MTEKTERERWEDIVSHRLWDGSTDIDYLMANYDIDDAEDGLEYAKYWEGFPNPISIGEKQLKNKSIFC